MAINENNMPVIKVDGGLNTGTTPLMIDTSQSPNCENVIFEDGKVTSRTGLIRRTDPAEQTWDSNQPAIIYKFYHHQNFDATARDYFWSFGQTTTRMVGHYWSGSQWVRTINRTTTLNESDEYTVYTGKVIDENNAEYMIVNYGDRTTLGLGTTPTPCYYDQGANSLVTGSTAKFKYIVPAYGKLVGFNGSATGAEAATKVTWSASLFADGIDLTTEADSMWTEADSQSGFAYLDDTEGAILGATLIRNTLICFKEDSIWAGNELSASPYIRWQRLYPDIGLLAPGLFAKLGKTLFFVGNNNIYAYAGGAELQPIGDAVWNSLKDDIGTRDNTSTSISGINSSFTTTDIDRGNIYFWIPTRGDYYKDGFAPYPDKAYVFNVFSGAWSTITAPENNGVKTRMFTGGGTREEGDLETLELQDRTYTYLGSRVETKATGSLSDADVILQSNQVYYDSDADGNNIKITSYFETKDFIVSMDEPTNWQQIFVFAELPPETATSCSLDLDVYLDGSTSTSETYTITVADGDPVIHKSNFNKKSNILRVKFSADTINTGFAIMGYELVHSIDERTSR
jgi:hypothetical protein